MIRLVVLAFILLAATPARAQFGDECGTFPLPPCEACGTFPLPPCCDDGSPPPCGDEDCGEFPLPPCDAICGIPGTPPCYFECGTETTPLCPTCGTATTPPCPEASCGTLTTPPCEVCGNPGEPACCGGAGQPSCQVIPACGTEGLPPCMKCGGQYLPDCTCDVPGTPNCLSPPVVRCGQGALPACVDSCLETLALPTCVASGEEGCLAHRWTFDEDSGTTVFDSAGTGHGTLVGAATRTAGLQGNALYIPPRYVGYVDVDSSVASIGAADFTMSVWVRTSLDAADSTILDVAGVKLVQVAGFLDARLHGVAHAVNLPLSHSRWNHVAITRSGLTVARFVNGYAVNVSSGQVESLVAPPYQRFGPTTGVIEDVRIYQGALAPEQVRLLAAGRCALPTD